MRMIGWRTVGKFDNLIDLQKEIDKRRLTLMIDCGWWLNLSTGKYELKIPTGRK